MMSERCAICDCDGEGNIVPESAGMLCAQHQTIDRTRAFVVAGAVTDFGEDERGYHINHYSRMIGPTIAAERARVYDDLDASMGGMGLARYIRLHAEIGVTLDDVDAKYDTSGHESAGDGLWCERGIVAHWIRDELERVIVERRKGQAA